MYPGDGQSGLSTITEFFNTMSATGDVGSALSGSAVWYKIAIWLIMTIGAIAMAIWIARIAIDIVLIVTKGMGKGDGGLEGLSKFGTGKSESYESVWKYVKGNLLEIILVIILITLLMTGWLLRLIAMAISGVGTLANRLLGMDIGGKLSALDAEAFIEQVGVQRTSSLRNQYDEQLASAKTYSAHLYDMAKDGAISDDPAFQQTKSFYSQAMVKADILADELESRDAKAELKLGDGYFQQHLRQSGEGVCNTSFLTQDVMSVFNKNISCN